MSTPAAPPSAATPAALPAEAVAAGWVAELDLSFARRDSGSYLAQRRQYGPLTVQKILYPEGPQLAHALLLHPPGGIAGGDSLRVGIDVQAGAQALLTTPGASKWYRSAGAPASQRLRLQVAAAATLEWLPQESIVFDGALASSQLQIDIEAGGRFLGWDIVCLGRPAAAAPFASGQWHSQIQVRQQQQLLWAEQGRLHGDSPVLRSRAGLAGFTVHGTLLAIGATPDTDLLHALRALPVDGLSGVTLTPRGVLLVRVLAASAESARHYLAQAWALLRPVYIACPAVAPRIWMT